MFHLSNSYIHIFNLNEHIQPKIKIFHKMLMRFINQITNEIYMETFDSEYLFLIKLKE